MVALSIKCYFGDFWQHPHQTCLALGAMCHPCWKKGHFAKVCHAKLSVSSGTSTDSNRLTTLTIVTSAATLGSLKKAAGKKFIKGVELEGFIDSVSSENFSHLWLRAIFWIFIICLELFSWYPPLSVQTSWFCLIDLKIGTWDYQGVHLAVLPELCSNVVLAQSFQ